MTVCDKGRGCPCEYHEKRREYARQRYAEKYKGVPRNRATGRELATTRNTLSGSRMEPRLVESPGEEGTIFHWMPKDGEEWECPQCGEWFRNLDGEWKPVLAA